MIRVSPYVYPGMPKAFIESGGSGEHYARLGHIIKIVSGYFNIPVTEIKNGTEYDGPLKARYAFVYLAIKYSNYRGVDIARFLNKHHSTIIHNRDNMKLWMSHKSGDWIRKDVEKIEKILTSE